VGGTSTLLDAGLHFVLMFVILIGGKPLGVALGRWLQSEMPQIFGMFDKPSDAAFPVLKVLTSIVGILNGFYWNRRWTFKIQGKEEAGRQLAKFSLVAVTGLCLNTLISTGLNNVIAGHPKRSWLIATIIATIVVAFWNFTGHRIWTFKKKA
jgi:putative flippase GtrA